MPYKAITHDSRHPFETNALIGAAWMGGTTLITNTWPYSLNQGLPNWMLYVWSGFVLGGSLVALFGIVWKRREFGLLLEQVGLVTLAFAILSYVVTMVFYGTFGSLAIAGILTGVAAACLQQWWRIEKTLRAIFKLTDEMKGATDGK